MVTPRAASGAFAAPETIALFRCVACDAMGAERDCVDRCDFQKFVVVEAELYADQWAALEESEAALAAFAPLLARLRALEDGAALRAQYDALRADARAALRAPAPAPPPAVAPQDERFTLWRCVACGQAEAPQECLGVCVRPVRDYAREADYLALAHAARAARRRVEDARALARDLAWTRPRDTHWSDAARRLREAARALLD